MWQNLTFLILICKMNEMRRLWVSCTTLFVNQAAHSLGTPGLIHLVQSPILISWLFHSAQEFLCAHSDALKLQADNIQTAYNGKRTSTRDKIKACGKDTGGLTSGIAW